MVESNWWDVSPWWAQSLIVMGGIVIYIIIGIMTYFIVKKVLENDGSPDESVMMMAILWPIGLPFILVVLIIKLLIIPFKLEEIKDEIQIIKQDVREIKKIGIDNLLYKNKNKNKK